MEILDANKDKFGTDFVENKKILEEISIVRSKGLKNELAGFITKFIKREIRNEEEKLQKEKESQKEENSAEIGPTIKIEEQKEQIEIKETESENTSS
jgi:small subunit ribosomal protein S17e